MNFIYKLLLKLYLKTKNIDGYTFVSRKEAVVTIIQSK